MLLALTFNNTYTLLLLLAVDFFFVKSSHLRGKIYQEREWENNNSFLPIIIIFYASALSRSFTIHHNHLFLQHKKSTEISENYDKWNLHETKRNEWLVHNFLKDNGHQHFFFFSLSFLLHAITVFIFIVKW